jgi:hypothetical protein
MDIIAMTIAVTTPVARWAQKMVFLMVMESDFSASDDSTRKKSGEFSKELSRGALFVIFQM